MEFLENKKHLEEKKKYYLVENSGVFISQGLPVVLNFINSFRKDLEFCFQFIMYCQPSDLKQISNFLMNNLFDDIFNNHLTDELLSIIFRCLEKEINEISGPEKFLENSKCRILFEGLFNNPKIKYFFHLIVSPIVENIENKNYDKWILNINEIINDLNNNLNEYEAKGIFSEKNNQEQKNKEFNEKYFSDVTKNYLEDLLEKTNDDFSKEYIKKQIELYESNENIYSNNKLTEEIKNAKDSNKIFILYKQTFLKIKRVIDYLILCLNEKIHLMPLSLKIICKMIKILVNKKHKNCSLLTQNLYVGKFFFEFLLFQCLENLDYGCLCGTYIISKTTQKNFNSVILILKQLFSFEFFNSNNNYSLIPFNSYFLNELLSLVSKLFSELTNITFSPFIEKIIQNENIYYYDYFKENPEEIIHQTSFCFSINELKLLFKIADSNFIPEFKEILVSNKESIEKMRNIYTPTLKRFKHDSSEFDNIILEEEKQNKIFYFLFTKLKFNEEFLKYEKIESSDCFTRKELISVKTEEELLENNLIKIDNFLVKLLYINDILNQRDFSELASKDLIELLNELIKILKTGRLNFNSPVPPEWYGKSLVNLLINLPEKYKKNNYDKILSLLKLNIQKSIDFLDPKIFTHIYEKFKYINERKELLTYVEECLLNIEQNNILNNFFNQEIHTLLSLNKTCVNGKSTFKIKSISHLIEIFPDLTTKEKNGKNKSLDNQKEDFIPEFLINYFNVINDKLKDSKIIKNIDFINKYNEYENSKSNLDSKNKSFCFLFDGFKNNLEEYLSLNFSLFEDDSFENYDISFFLKIYQNKYFEFISDKIENYIMNKLYSRIFPLESSHKDIKIYRKAIQYSWIEPKHLIQNEELFKYNFFNEIIVDIQNLDYTRSPISKMKLLALIFNKIEKSIIFNLPDEICFVSNYIIPFFVYCLIKSKPRKLWSNLIYIKYYHGKSIDQQIFCQFQVAVTMLENLAYNNLINVSKEEFEENCKKYLPK